MKKISVSLSGHRTSISLESEFIHALRQICADRGHSVAEIIGRIDATRGNRNLSSAIRVWILQQIRK